MCISTLKVPKPDLKGKNNKDYPTVRIKLELIGGLLFFHTHLTLSVTNPLVKQTHDCKLVVDQLAFRLAGQLSSFFPRSWEVETLCPCV
jgi:hypothetical protein